MQETKSALFDAFVNENNPLSDFSWSDIEDLLQS
jgi:hypothetical protein